MSRKIIKKSTKYPHVHLYQKGGKQVWGYRLKYKDHTGNRREKTGSDFDSEVKAYRDMIKVENDINQGKMHLVNPSKMTFGEFLEILIEEYKPNDKGVGFWSVGTYKSYQLFLKKYVKGTIHHVKLTHLTAELYRKEFINKIDGISPHTIKLYHNKANMVMNEAVSREYIVRNRIKGVKLPQNTEQKKENFLTIEELQLFLKSVDEIDDNKFMLKTLFYLLIYSGMRVGESRALNWNDVDFNNGKIRINKSIGPENRIGLTKSRNTRTIEIQQEVINMLKILKKKRINEKRYKGDNDYIFKSYQSDLPVSYMNIRYNSMKISSACLGRKISPHCFRHTHASILLMSGQPLKVVAIRLGNTENTLIKHYSHIINGISTSPVDVFNESIGGKDGASSNVIHLNK